ncbi:MAG: PP2C family protein-serine/threonine phosphatase, partial [bacterium]|nr:PP2C family protein-serine/threonine phosphatase [bacterium]
ILGDDFGTTAVVAFFEGEKLLVANVGDARAVLVENDSFERLSKDHKPNDPEEMDRIKKAGGEVTRMKVYKLKGKIHRIDFDNRAEQQKLAKQEAEYVGSEPFRINGEIAMSRALGDQRYKDGLVIADPDIKTVEVSPGDKKLILACDGVWDVITDEEAAGLVRGESDPQKAAEILKNKAIENGSKDNISVIVINLSPEE